MMIGSHLYQPPISPIFNCTSNGDWLNFVECFEIDVALSIPACLDDPADLVHAAVSHSWCHLVILLDGVIPYCCISDSTFPSCLEDLCTQQSACNFEWVILNP
ncbi:hypothetical protein Pfo_001272 [Paulownia fortunei]|nr:hypothetical protein Pfo_001272 [Paulownia fortunei]